MFCKKCGKLISDGDKFCSKCGEKVESLFDSGFRQEAPKKPQGPEKPKKQFHMEEFNWNLDGYPVDQTKTTDDIDFNWASVVEEKQRRIFANILGPESESESEPEEEEKAEIIAAPEPEEEKTIEEEIFGDLSPTLDSEPTKVIDKVEKDQPVDKFYTFNKKNEALQALLDQEYEKIKNGDEEDEPFEPMFKVEADTPDELEAGDVYEELKEEPLQFVDVALAQTPESVIALEEEPEPVEQIIEEPEKTGEPEIVEEPEAVAKEPVEDEFPKETEENCPPRAEETEEIKEKGPSAKLTFDDVFSDDDDYDDDEERPKKKSKALKVIAIILCILIAFELAIIGIMHFGKGTALAEKLNDSYLYIVNLISKDEPKDEGQVAVESDTAKAIKAQLTHNKNIGIVEENQKLTIDLKKDYGIDELSETVAFSDKSWYTDDNGAEVNYGDEIIGTIIKYYSSWVNMANGTEQEIFDYIDDTSELYEELESFQNDEEIQYGINKLEIGEIRSGSRGYYIATSVTKVSSDAKEDTVEKGIIYMEPMEKTMKILNIYKF